MSSKGAAISTKLFLSNLVYVVPVLTLVFFLVKTKNENIDFAKGELKGNQYQRPVMKVMKDLSNYGILTQRYFRGSSENVKAEISALEAKINSNVEQLIEVDQKVGADLQFTDSGLQQRKREHLKVANFKAEWEELKKQNLHLKPTQNAEKFTHLMADLRGYIAHLGDTSNLILDPDLDSYYLMDVTLLALPQMLDRLQEILRNTEAQTWGSSNSLANSERIQNAVYASMLKQSDLDRVTADAQTAMNEDKNFYRVSEGLQIKVPRAVQEVSQGVEGVLKLLNDSVGSESGKIDRSEWIQSVEKTLNQAYALWELSADELDVLLQKRIDDQQAKKMNSLYMSLAALVMAAFISTGLGLSLRNGIVRSVSEAAVQIKMVTAKIGDYNQRLVQASSAVSSGTTQQAAAIQETVATLDQINAMAGRSVQNAERSTKEAQKSHEVAVQGKKVVEEMVSSISDIQASNQMIMAQTEASNQKITEIVKVIGEIANKTKVINDIVFQTKLLSFNASVEAARAGEHGKGFAVVAEEVGNLAQMSGNAAKEISELLGSSLETVNSIVLETKSKIESLVHAGKSKVETGIVVARKCGDVFEEVLRNVTTVDHMMGEVSQASKEQAQGVSQISTAMNQLDGTVNENARNAQETSGLSAALTEEVKALNEVIVLLERQGGKKADVSEPERLISADPEEIVSEPMEYSVKKAA